MAATTKLLQLRPKTLSTTAASATTSTSSSIHFFSSSTTPDPNNAPSPQPNAPPPPPPPPPQNPQFQLSSYFNDVKASLKQQQQRNSQQSQSPRKPLSFSSRISHQPNPPSKSDSLAEIQRNLSEYRRRAAAPPPSPPPPPSSATTTSGPHSPQHFSFQEMYQNLAAKREESSPDASAGGRTLAFNAIRESLRSLKPSVSNNQSQGGGGMNNPMSNPRSRGSFKIPSLQRVFGGSDHLPASIFGGEARKKEEGNNSTDSKVRMEFFKTYRYEELGPKLRALRPEKRDKKDWFSLEELSERLVKLREMEEKERDTMIHGVVIRDLQESLVAMKKQNEQSPRSMYSHDILGQIGRTPSFMLFPPKEELVEKYFHPDNMSASEKLKLELGKVRDEFKISDLDCGSARVQVAQLTTKIKHLSSALHKKDKHSRKGLEAMVQRRKKLLKYLRRTDWDSYCFVLSKLGLRDNPDDIAKKKNYPSQRKDLSGKKKALKN